MYQILGISGSLRRQSFNSALLRAFADYLTPNASLQIAVLKGIPVYDEDEREAGMPACVMALGEAIRNADAVVIATPEYNFSVPGGLKNALDWVSRLPEQPFQGKPVALMGASTGRLGTARAQYHLRQCLQFLDTRTLNKPEVFVSYAASAFDGERLVDPGANEALRQLGLALIKSIHKPC